MRTWLFDTLTQHSPLQAKLGGTLATTMDRVNPRQSKLVIPANKPFLVYGLGNLTDENLAEALDHTAQRQFFQIWIHDNPGSYLVIDSFMPIIRKLLVGKVHAASLVSNVLHLEDSAEFSNETYNTIFRYMRFQAILSEGKVPA